VQKYISLTGHKYELTPFLIGKRSWDKLSDADKKAVQEAAAEATALQRKLAQESDEKMFAELKAKGVQIDKVDQGPFMTATAPVVAKWEAGPIGPFVKKVVVAARAK
jgi:TRAP-type transport system periplasmic protein